MDPQARLQERLEALRVEFVGGLPARLGVMRRALAAGDRETLRREAHRLAGTGASYGLPRMGEWGRATEQRVRAGADAAELATALEQLAELIAAVREVRSASG